MNKYKMILVLSFIVISLVGCTKENRGKQVLSYSEGTGASIINNEDKNALDIIQGKCIISDNDRTLYPVITNFGRDYVFPYIKDTDIPYYKVQDVIADKNKVTYKVESEYYQNIEYADIVIEVVDNNTIKYSYDNSPSTEYKLYSKAEAAVFMKEYEEKVANGLTIEDKKSDYIIADSSTRVLNKPELSQYSKTELSYIRNEIFARYGYVFKSEEYQAYFSSKAWYIPDESFDGDINRLNPIEKENVALLKALEGEN